MNWTPRNGNFYSITGMQWYLIFNDKNSIVCINVTELDLYKK